MTLLLAVCVVLLSASRLDPGKLADAAGSVRAAFGMGAQPVRSASAAQSQGLEFQQAILLVRIKEKLDSMLKNTPDAKALEVLTVDEGFLVRLGHEAIFGKEPLTLRPEVKPVLKQFAALLKEMSNVIRIEGHTSDRPPPPGGAFANNWVLSAAEAATLAHFLATEGGVDPLRLVVRGQGEYAPCDTNSTAAGQARNRRIDLLLTREVRAAPVPATPAQPEQTSPKPSTGSVGGQS